MFDAIAEPDENWRVFQFIVDWHDGASYGYVDTRQGDCVRAALAARGGIVWGYNEGSPLSEPPAMAVADEALALSSPIPVDLRRMLQEPEFDCGGATFCLWRSSGDSNWRTLELMHRSPRTLAYPFEFLEMLIGDPRPFTDWVHEYYDREDIDGVIGDLYQHVPLSGDMISTVNPSCPKEAAKDQARVIGYPTG